MSWNEIILSNIFDRIGSKSIGLKFVGSSMSPDLRVDIIIECFHDPGSFYDSGNTLVIIDVFKMSVMYIVM